MDLAFEGDGFLKIKLPNGEDRYTRDGSLRINSTGNLVTADGFLVEPQITFPQDTKTISIGTDGTVSVINSANTISQLSPLQLTRFPNPGGLSSEGSNLYAETPASGTALAATPGQTGTGFLRQGFLEGSNVDVVTELVSLIMAQRAYEFNTRAIRTADEMMADTNNMTR
jgi:flagellar basal-body rod protein FlgG